MNPIFLCRLAFDLVAAGLLLTGLAYYWQGNTIHELAGAGLFLLVIAHNVFNRRWYGAIPKSRREPRGMVNIGITLLLVTSMLALLVTSVMISNTLASFLPLDGGFTARQIHTLAGYWALVIVAIHLGLRWPMIMRLARNFAGITVPSSVRTVVLRVAAVAIAIQGARSSFQLDIGTRLSMQTTLDWWNFEDGAAGFFLHCMAIAGLYIVVTFYATQWWQLRKRTPSVGYRNQH